MKHNQAISRRSFLALAAAAPMLPSVLQASAAKPKRLPIGLELFSVREELRKDLPGTLRAVAKMGYDGVEFFSPYFEWTPEYAREVRQLLDELRLPCLSTHNGPRSFTPEGLDKAIELNRIMGSKYIIMASAGRVTTLADWQKVAETLNRAAEKLKPLGMQAGFHNHRVEFVPLEGKRPMDLLAANTSKDVVLQFDVGTCLEAGADPIAWIKANPGRIGSIHCKDWSPEPGKGYRVLFGEGAAPWKKIMQAAEKSGGLKYYLVEQEGSDYPPFETAERCLKSFKALHKTI